MPLIIFHFNCILLLMMKMNKKQFLFRSLKIRAEGRSPLTAFIHLHFLPVFRRGGGAVGKNVRPTSGRLGVRIQPTTDLSR